MTRLRSPIATSCSKKTDPATPRHEYPEQPGGIDPQGKILEKLIIEDNAIREAKAASVWELMDYPRITADPLSDIRRVAKIMYDHDLNCIPMTNESDMFVGLITRTDLVYAISNFPGSTLRA